MFDLLFFFNLTSGTVWCWDYKYTRNKLR